MASTCSNPRRKHHLIGQPDKQSNMVPLNYRAPINEDEKTLFEFQRQVWNFNHEFWKRHNQDFQSRKKEFVEKELAKKGGSQTTKLTAEELSEFYKMFLNEEYHKHMVYLRQWMKLNIKLTGMSFLVRMKTLLGLSKKSSQQ